MSEARGAQLFEAVFQQAPDPIVVLDSDGCVLRINARAERLFGHDDHALRGTRIGQLLPGGSQRVATARGQRAEEAGVGPRSGSWTTFARRADGSRVQVIVSTSWVAADNESLCVTVIREAGTGRDEIESIARAVLHDPLTGLPNRDLFMDRLGRAFRRAGRRSDFLFAVLMLDLDRFKVVNGSLGHRVGDELLRAISRRLEDSVRTVDTIARLGGDEFAILLDDIKDAGDAIRVADRVLGDVSVPFRVAGHEVYATASIGIALSAPRYESEHEVLRDADTAMYRAKALGKARHEMFDAEMHDRAVARLRLEAELRQAIEAEEFRVHYQPIVAGPGGRIVGLEALVRWEHPRRGMISPGEFIPVAEETGLIVPIGSWVLQTACERLKQWHAEGYPDLRMAVNCSARQFEQAGFDEIVGDILESTGLDGRFIELEITEGVVMKDIGATVATLHGLRARDIRIAIDDFGTGYSALGYLKSLPITTLKIDQSFVRDVNADPGTAAIVGAIVNLAHSLQLNVIAEGVETPEQLDFLLSQDCDEYQGFLISRPIPAEAVGGLFRH